jgi:hypothetical protein
MSIVPESKQNVLKTPKYAKENQLKPQKPFKLFFP